MGHCLSSDSWLLDAFVVAPHHHHYKEIVLVVWQPPSVPWVKVNTDGSVVRQHVTCGGIFRDNRGSLMGWFAGNIGAFSVFEAEIFGYAMAMELALQQGWGNIWVENDSTSVLLAFKNASLWCWSVWETGGTTAYRQVFRWFLHIYSGRGIVVRIVQLIIVTVFKVFGGPLLFQILLFFNNIILWGHQQRMIIAWGCQSSSDVCSPWFS